MMMRTDSRAYNVPVIYLGRWWHTLERGVLCRRY